MKKLTAVFLTAFLVVMTGAWACEFSTAALSDMTISKDKDGKEIASTFKPGDTIYARATVSGSMSKHTVKFKVTADDVKGMTKGETVKGSEMPVELASSGVAILTLPVPQGVMAGKYTVVADMVDEKGEVKGNKTASVTIDAPPAPAPAAPTSDDDASDDKKEDK